MKQQTLTAVAMQVDDAYNAATAISAGMREIALQLGMHPLKCSIEQLVLGVGALKAKAAEPKAAPFDPEGLRRFNVEADRNTWRSVNASNGFFVRFDDLAAALATPPADADSRPEITVENTAEFERDQLRRALANAAERADLLNMLNSPGEVLSIIELEVIADDMACRIIAQAQALQNLQALRQRAWEEIGSLVPKLLSAALACQMSVDGSATWKRHRKAWDKAQASINSLRGEFAGAWSVGVAN